MKVALVILSNLNLGWMWDRVSLVDLINHFLEPEPQQGSTLTINLFHNALNTCNIKKANSCLSPLHHGCHIDPDRHDGIGIWLNVDCERELDPWLAVEVDAGGAEGVRQLIGVGVGEM